MSAPTKAQLQTADDIEAMADYIKKYGWVQGSYYGGTADHPAACILGACRQVIGIDEPTGRVTGKTTKAMDSRYVRATNAIENEIEATVGWSRTIPGWNDDKNTDRRSVLNLLRRTVRKLRKGAK